MLNPATSIKYMIAGYGVILTVLGIYLASLFVRWKNLKRDLKTLAELTKQ